MLRSMAAVFAGYAVFGASAALLFPLSGRDPRVRPGPGFLAFSVIYGAAFAFAGGYLAALIARRRGRLHAAILGAIIAAIALASMAAQFRSASVWSEVAAVLLMAPSAVLGGYLYDRRRARP